jgi:hypothetical protein
MMPAFPCRRYNLADNDGKTGDQFMRNIEQLAAHVPYMVNHGNHEDSAGDLAHYIERFRSQPSNAVPPTFTSANGATTNTMYFSWDEGLVHYISLSTELWFGVGDNHTHTASLLQWLEDPPPGPPTRPHPLPIGLEADLIAANQHRTEVPWIVMQGHRSVYCSCDGDCDGAAKTVRKDLEPLLFKYGVDFFINGHEHNYERSFPLYQGQSSRSNLNPTATIYIVSGAAGNSEMHEPFTKPQPSWSAFRSNTFGYSRMWVYNATHIHWQQAPPMPPPPLRSPSCTVRGPIRRWPRPEGSPTVGTRWGGCIPGWVLGAPWLMLPRWGSLLGLSPHVFILFFPSGGESEYGAVIDDAWIIQTRPHGPFDAALAPSGLAVPTGNHTREMQVEHWWLLLDLEDGSGRRTEAIIATLVLKKSTSAF